MRRRTYLTLVGTGLFAGCGGSDGGGGTPTSGDGGGAQPTDTVAAVDTSTPTDQSTSSEESTPTETTTDTPTPQANIELVSAEYREVESDFGSTAAVITEVQNTGGQTYAYVETTAQFTNDAGDVVASRTTNLTELPPGETWVGYHEYVQAGEVSDGTAELTDTTRGDRSPTAEELGLTILDESLTEGDDISGPTLIGRVRNDTGDTLDYLQAHVLWYDTDSNVRSSSFTNITNLATGDTWRFELEFLSLAPDVEIGEYELRFSDSAL